MKGIRGDVDDGDEEKLSMIYMLITLFGRSTRWRRRLAYTAVDSRRLGWTVVDSAELSERSLPIFYASPR